MQTKFLRSSASTSQYNLNWCRCFASKMWEIIPVETRVQILLKLLKNKSESGRKVILVVIPANHRI